MKRNLTVTCLFLSLLQASTFAGTGETYFIGSGFKAAKSVQMLGATASQGNLEREDHINRVVETNSQRLQYCYERVLVDGSLSRVESVIYFTVNVDGKFSNITADLLNIDSSTPNIATFFSCISQQIKTFRASSWESDNIFRFLVTFEKSI